MDIWYIFELRRKRGPTMNVKRILIALLALCLMIGMIPMQALADDEVYYGSLVGDWKNVTFSPVQVFDIGYF